MGTGRRRGRRLDRAHRRQATQKPLQRAGVTHLGNKESIAEPARVAAAGERKAGAR